MNGNHRHRHRRAYRAGAAVVAALLVAATLTAARPGIEWAGEECGTGEIVEYGLEHRPDADYVRLAGWTLPCEPESSAFYVIVYTAQGGWMSRMYSFVAGPGPKPFTALVDYAMSSYQGPAVAACVAYDDYEGRVSCVAVDGTGDPAVFRIPVDDVRVVTPTMAGICGNCVSYPAED